MANPFSNPITKFLLKYDVYWLLFRLILFLDLRNFYILLEIDSKSL